MLGRNNFRCIKYGVFFFTFFNILYIIASSAINMYSHDHDVLNLIQFVFSYTIDNFISFFFFFVKYVNAKCMFNIYIRYYSLSLGYTQFGDLNQNILYEIIIIIINNHGNRSQCTVSQHQLAWLYTGCF